MTDTQSSAWQKMLTENEQIMHVDSADNFVSTVGKLEAHQGKGKLHRAITVFLFNKKGETLLTQRSAQKPLWPLWWDAACSTHQWVGEEDIPAALRRLPFEVGYDSVTNLRYVFKYEYHAIYSPKWAENEVNHILFAEVETDPQPNPREVANWRWASLERIERELENPDHNFAPWFPLAIEKFPLET